MTEDDARRWFASRYPAETLARLETYQDLLKSEGDRQNLISASTRDSIWARHFLDSAQLLTLAPEGWQRWVDIGSGAGLPGIVLGVLEQRAVVLIEPRRLRVEFLQSVCRDLALTNVSVIHGKAETTSIDTADVISARAVSKLDRLFLMSAQFTDRSTVYLLPKGQGASREVASVRRTWQGRFHVEQSIVDPESGIVVASGISQR